MPEPTELEALRALVQVADSVRAGFYCKPLEEALAAVAATREAEREGALRAATAGETAG